VALVIDLADGDSMSAGESLSRVQMFRLGLPRPRLQAKHEDEQGLIGYVDFDWDGVIGEFDGKLKYRVPADADPSEAAEIVWREKKREDRLRAHSEVVRWTWDIALDRDRLGALLAGRACARIHGCRGSTWARAHGEPSDEWGSGVLPA